MLDSIKVVLEIFGLELWREIKMGCISKNGNNLREKIADMGIEAWEDQEEKEEQEKDSEEK